MGSTSNLVLYFLLTNTYSTTSLILKLVLHDSRPWGRLAFDMLLPSNKSLVTSLGKTEVLSIFCVAALGPWSVHGLSHVLQTQANCKKGLRAAGNYGVVLSFILGEKNIFFLCETEPQRCSNAAVRKYYML